MILRESQWKTLNYGSIAPSTPPEGLRGRILIPEKDSIESAAGGNFLDKMPRDMFENNRGEQVHKFDHNSRAIASCCLRNLTLWNKEKLLESGFELPMNTVLLELRMIMNNCRAVIFVQVYQKTWRPRLVHDALVSWKSLSLHDLTPTCMTLELARGLDNFQNHRIGNCKKALRFYMLGYFTISSRTFGCDLEPDPRVPYFSGVWNTLKKVGLSDTIAEMVNSTPYYDPIVALNFVSTLSPFGDSDSPASRRSDSFLGLAEMSGLSQHIKPLSSMIIAGGHSLILEAILNTILHIMNLTEVELKERLPISDVCIFWRGDNKLPSLLLKSWMLRKKSALRKGAKVPQRALAWKLLDIRVSIRNYCYPQDSYWKMTIAPADQHRRRVYPLGTKERKEDCGSERGK
ncbi:hypothetical protein Tco_0732151 [Tanacetum coccineum]